MKDLLVLAADKDIRFAIEGLLNARTEALGIRAISLDCYVHPHKDPGCLKEAAEFLRPFLNTYRRALVVFDREGCGQESLDAIELESRVTAELEANGWGGRARTLVIDPEVEVWVWSDSPHLDEIMGWGGASPSLREWLTAEGFRPVGSPKPGEPKAAFEESLRRVSKARSSVLFGRLASTVQFRTCRDQAFLRFRSIVTNWFSPESSH